MRNKESDQLKERDAELSKRAADLDRICRELLPILMTTNEPLDGSVESLKLIDQKADKLREIMNILNPVADSKGASVMMSKEAVMLMLGSYLGEMARRELEPKGVAVRWEASEEKQSIIHAHLIITRGNQEERWAVFYEAREWLNGRSDLVFFDSMVKLLLIA